MARCLSVDLTAFLKQWAKLFKTSSRYSCCSLPQGEISAIARENSGVSFILCQTLEFCPLYRMLFSSPIRRFMYSRSTRCAFQYLPWCAAAVCDPISRLSAWTKAEVISMGCISIFIAFIWIFAFPSDTTAPDWGDRRKTHVFKVCVYETSHSSHKYGLQVWNMFLDCTS